MAYAKRRTKKSVKSASRLASRVAANSSLVQRKQKRKVKFEAARQLKLTPVAKQLIAREIKPHRELGRISGNGTMVIRDNPVTTTANFRELFSGNSPFVRGDGANQFHGDRVKLISFTCRFDFVQRREYHPRDDVSSTSNPSLFKYRFLCGQPVFGQQVGTFNGTTLNDFIGEFLRWSGGVHGYNGAWDAFDDMVNPGRFTKQFECRKRLKLSLLDLGVQDTHIQRPALAQTSFQWTYRPKNKILKFETAGGSTWPMNFNPIIVLLGLDLEAPHNATNTQQDMWKLHHQWDLVFEDIE